MSGDNDIDLMETIEACRTCGVFFLTGSNYLRQIFSSSVVDPDMMLIRIELSTWKVEIGEDDGFPQYICTGCIHEFQKLFKFRRSCVDIQNQWRHFYAVKKQHKNQIQIKSELPDEEKEDVCDFIYVDDISDSEYDGSITPFNIPHIPMKEELIEAAKIPTETPEIIIDIANRHLQKESYNKEQQFAQTEIIESTELTSSTADSKVLVGSNSIFAEANISEGNSQLEDKEEHSSANPTSLIRCEFCECIYLNKYEHKLHMKHIHEIKDLECHICGKTFKNSSAARLKFHLKWHKISKHRKCAQCGFFCNSRNALREHTREMHSKVSCTICRKLVLPKKMELHMQTHNINMAFNCTHCTQAFNTLDEQKQHIIHNHVDESYENTEVVEESLGNHLENEENTRIYIGVICALCDEKFSNTNELQIHIENVHRTVSKNATENRIPLDSIEMPQGLAQTYCINCNEGFNDEETLAQHMQVAQCAIDNNVVNSLNNIYVNNVICNEELMENHMSQLEQYANAENYAHNAPNLKVESNEDENISKINQLGRFQNFKCAQCFDTFDNVDELRKHHDTMHSMKSVFPCHICGKVYELKFSLNRHLKKHNNA